MRPGSRLLRKPASCDQSCRSTSAISTAERTGASNRSPAHTQGPIAQAASAQKMFLTRSATDVLQGLPACRQHCPHSAKISAPSFNPASMRSRSRLQSGPRRVTRPHRTLQIRVVARCRFGRRGRQVLRLVAQRDRTRARCRRCCALCCWRFRSIFCCKIQSLPQWEL